MYAKSDNTGVHLIIDADGNLVIRGGTKTGWQCGDNGCGNRGTGPYRLLLQNDGNLVLSDVYDTAIWVTGTSFKGTPPFNLEMQTDENLVLYDSARKVLWDRFGFSPNTQNPKGIVVAASPTPVTATQPPPTGTGSTPTPSPTPGVDPRAKCPSDAVCAANNAAPCPDYGSYCGGCINGASVCGNKCLKCGGSGVVQLCCASRSSCVLWTDPCVNSSQSCATGGINCGLGYECSSSSGTCILAPACGTGATVGFACKTTSDCCSGLTCKQGPNGMGCF